MTFKTVELMSPTYYLFILKKLEFLLHSKEFWLQAVKLRNLDIKPNQKAGVQYWIFKHFHNLMQ